jgi:hypothetical protein
MGKSIVYKWMNGWTDVWTDVLRMCGANGQMYVVVLDEWMTGGWELS